MAGLELKTVGVGLLFGVFVGFKSKFNFTRGGTNCSKPPFLCVRMVCRGTNAGRCLWGQSYPGAVHAILYICCEIRKSAAAALKRRVAQYALNCVGCRKPWSAVWRSAVLKLSRCAGKAWTVVGAVKHVKNYEKACKNSVKFEKTVLPCAGETLVCCVT